jgi:hypothetical protein
MKPDAFKDFDTSYWQPKNKVWMAEREQQWREIEKLLYGQHKGKKATAIIKRYFFKGTLPDWKKLEDWDNEDGHLDLMLFLYLHPSQDEEVLRPLRDAYMSSYQVKRRDIMAGLSSLMRIACLTSCSGGYDVAHCEVVEKEIPHLASELRSLPPEGEKPPYIYYKELIMHTQGNNERLFGLMRPDPKQVSFHLPGEQHKTLMYAYSYENLGTWSKWLTLELPLNLGAQDMLFQYDLPLETWYCQCVLDNVPTSYAYLQILLVALYRIANFKQQAEDDERRAHFSRKLICMFNEREFTPAFKTIWEHVKTGGVEVESPWEHEYGAVSSALLNATRGG